MADLNPLPPPETPLDFGPVQFLPGKKGGRYPYCHSLIISGEDTWVVDPASDKARLGKMARSRRVTRVFLSHFHEDHLKYAFLFPEAEFFVPEPELPAFRSFEGIFALTGATAPELQAYLRETLVRDFHFRPFSRLRPYRPEDRFTLGAVTLEIMAAPGHTPGHSCFAFPGQDLIYLADVDLTPFGPWYGDAASCLEDYLTTLAALQETRAGVYLTAHEQGVFTPRQAREGLAYFSQIIAARDAAILELLATPRTLEDLVAAHPIYRRPRDPALVYDHMEGQMLKHHVHRLMRQGKVEVAPRGFIRC
jgi:hydroxyacylglutathione hydrolase